MPAGGAASLPTSVVVVSHGRPRALERCLAGLAQLDHPDFEIVVVCDSASGARIAARADAPRLKHGSCARLNVSTARNRGLALAAGEVVAFIDDDAVPEPTWLDRLTAPFADPEVTSAGGFVRGRNGVSFQWRAASADAAGRRFDRLPGERLPAGEVWRTEGTNMAFRAAALREIGGFDEAFAFYLDETDVNLRLPGRCVLVPDAEVHHGFAAGPRRRADRVPTSLFEIGASSSYFMRKHEYSSPEARVAEIRGRERRRLLRHMVAGRLEPRDVRRLMAELDAGLAEGTRREPRLAGEGPAPPPGFQRYRETPPGAKVALAGAWGSRKHLAHRAIQALSEGLRPTVILLSPTTRPLRVAFQPEGWWLHHVGRFGRGARHAPASRPAGRAGLIVAEHRRIAPIRGLGAETCALQWA